MTRIVVGGHTRNIGKIQLAVEIIQSFPEARWTAVKITQYGHGICSVNGEACGCAPAEHPFAIQEEQDRDGRSDTSRFLRAGAARALWVRTKQGRLAEAMPGLRGELEGAENVLIESNTVLHFLRPDLYLTMLDFSSPDFKPSAREMLDRADAYVVVERGSEAPGWSQVSLKPLESHPVFRVQPDNLCPAELRELIRRRLFSPPGTGTG